LDGPDATLLGAYEALDFRYSPYVALYFAIRQGPVDKDRTHVRLWAIDAGAVNYRFLPVASNARYEQAKVDGTVKHRRVDPGDLDWYSTDRDSMHAETEAFRALVADSLGVTGTYRGEMNRRGCVCKVSPGALNSRLASQQGTFLLNLAEGLSFR
jgi:hypothetical protein